MLYINFNRVFTSRGIPNPQNFLVNNGFTRAVAFRIIHNQQSNIRFQYLERICEVLHCTPNDLLDYIPPQNSTLPKDHPLYNLCRPQQTVNLAGHLQNASANEIQEIEELIRKQRSKKE